MRWPIHMQLLLPMLSVVVLTIALASGAVAYWRVRQVHAQQAEGLRRMAATLADANFPLSDRVLKQMSDLSGAEFAVVDPAGQIEYRTLPIARGELPDVLRAAAADADDSFTAGPAVPLGERAFLVHRVPLVRRLTSGRAGTLLVLYPEDRWSAAVQQAAYPSLLAGLLMTAVVVGMTALVARRLVRPIWQLNRQAAAIAGGDFRPARLLSHNDELSDLAAALNGMAAQLGQYEAHVRQSERLRTLGQLGVGMAHQLRNAATGASMAIELHQRECRAADPETLAVALRQLRLMESYLRRFLALGRGQAVPHAAVSLAALVEDVLALVRPACAHAQIELLFAAEADNDRVWGDAESLRHLIINLVMNAVEAAGRGAARPQGAEDAGAAGVLAGPARVDVELERRHDRLLLRVKDTGPGPAPSTVERLFEAFVTEKPDGTGLGLWVARQIAEAHGGSIAFRRSEGTTCFEVDLPWRTC